MNKEIDIDELEKYGNRMKEVFDGSILEILRDSDKFVLSAPIVRETVKRFLQDKELIEDCHVGLKGSNVFKVAGYSSYWISKLKPVQILEKNPIRTELYVNEYLALAFANACFHEVDMPMICAGGLTDNLVYLLRHRTLTIRIMPVIYEAYIRGLSDGREPPLET